MDKEFLQAIIESGRINLNGSQLNLYHLEYILMALKCRSDLKIENCYGVMNLIELGAQLATSR